jgi:hypothetical protein
MSFPLQVSRVRVILDTNIWTYLVKQQEVERFENLEDQLGLVVVVPPSILIEVARATDPALRSQLVQAVTSRGKHRIHPPTEAKRLADELVSELRRLRPAWVWRTTETSAIARLEKHWTKGVWQWAAQDPVGFGEACLASEMETADAAVLEVQRENKAAALATGFRLVESEPWTDLVDQPAAEKLGWDGKRFHLWRFTAADLWWRVIVNHSSGAAGHSSLRDWLEPWLKRDAVREDREGWNRLWYSEAEASRMPRTWITEVLLAVQLQQKIGSGNPRDVQHAAYLFDADILLTADRRYATALGDVRRWTPADFAAVQLVPGEQSGSTVEAIAELLRS